MGSCPKARQGFRAGCGTSAGGLSMEPAADASAGDLRSVLEICGPDGAASRIPLAGARFIIGRAADATIRLDSDMVSRRHAELFRDPFGRWWVRDLGSHNGTLVGGERIGDRMLRLGEAVEIGRHVLRVTSEGQINYSGAAGRAAVPVTDEPAKSVTTLTELHLPRLSASHLARLLSFGRRLIEIESAEQRLRLLCGLMVSADFHGQWAAVMRLRKDRPDEPPRVLCEPAADPDCRAPPPRVSRGLMRTVLARGEPVLASNVPAGPVDVELSVAASVQAMSALACPLRSDAAAMDVLYVILPPTFGTSEWLALASLAAEEFGQAEFAWAASRQAEAYAGIEAELTQAAQIQKALIPSSPAGGGLDVAIRFDPCRWIGGDYVDIMPMTDGRTLLAIADVCGKGLQAALVAASVHSLIHASVRAGADPPRLMASLNEHLIEHLPRGSFVTLTVAAAAADTGRLEIVNAGHPPAVIVSRAGESRWLPSGVNGPLGLWREPFQVQAERLATGDILTMFTDGISDLRTAADRRLGMEWIGDQVRSICAQGTAEAAQIAERLAAAIDRIIAGGLADDDRTFLLARRV
jgi:serine phosphatase RsbU (regulator of sigma subunit)